MTKLRLECGRGLNHCEPTCNQECFKKLVYCMQIEVRKKLQNYNEVLHVEHKGMGLVDVVTLG